MDPYHLIAGINIFAYLSPYTMPTIEPPASFDMKRGSNNDQKKIKVDPDFIYDSHCFVSVRKHDEVRVCERNLFKYSHPFILTYFSAKINFRIDYLTILLNIYIQCIGNDPL